jgi:hypothetical protein
MMNKLNNVFSVLAVSLFFGFSGIAQNLSLLTQTAGTGDETTQKIATDASGNIFYAGKYKDATHIEGVTLASLGSAMSPPPYSNAYLAKHSNGGGTSWAIPIGGPSILFVDAVDITADAGGNVLFVVRAAILADTLHIGSLLSIPASGTPSSTVIVKLDSQGNLLWSQNLTSNIGAANLLTDSNDDFYFAGWQAGSITLDTITIAPTYGSQANFLSKLDANGNFLWGKSFGSKSNMGQWLNSAINAQNELFLSGGWEGDTIFMDNLIAVNPTPGGFFNTDRYIAKFDALGNALWIQREGGLEIDYSASLQVTSGGGVMAYSTVADSTSITINEGGTTVQGPKVLFSNYDSQGMLSWHNAITHGIEDNPGLWEFTGDGTNYYVGYNFTGAQITLGSTTLNNAGGNSGTSDIAIATLDSSANIVSAFNVGGIENERCFVLANNATTQELLFGGMTSSSEMVFGTDTLTNTGFLTTEGFIGGISKSSIGIGELESVKTVAIYPNPAINTVTINVSEFQNSHSDIQVFNSAGQVVIKKTLTDFNGELNLDVSNMPVGVYFLHVANAKNNYIGKFVKQ